MTLRATNLNLIPVLRSLLKHASVTRASAELGLSQPATSNALTRLRRVFDDPLLVQIGRTMRLTPRAKRLLPELDDVCAGIERLLEETAFVPARAHRGFVVATPDYIALLAGPALYATLARAAPGISVRFTDVPQNFTDQLTLGEIDIAVIAWPGPPEAGLAVERIYRDTLVGVVSQQHPFALAPPKDVGSLSAQPHIGVDSGVSHPDQFDALVRAVGSPADTLRLDGSQMLLLPLLASRTPCVTVVPQALAKHVAQWAPIAIFDLPGATVPIDVSLVWSTLHTANVAHRWFRSVLASALKPQT